MRHAFRMQLEPGNVAEYKKRHDEIWPELAQAIKDAGQSNYTLFRRGTTVIGYVECEPDAETALARIAATDVNARWSKWFEEIIRSPRTPDGAFERFDEVWHLD